MAFIIAVLLATFILVCVIIDSSRGGDFRDRFPPLTDAEFLARCDPGTDPRVALTVRAILQEALNVDAARIHPTSRLMADLGAA